MSDELLCKLWKIECGFVNFEGPDNIATHWKYYQKKLNKTYVFNLYGGLQRKYLALCNGKVGLFYNDTRI